MKQHPHTITILTLEPATRSESGDWQPSVSSPFNGLCRWEENSKGAVISAADGSQIAYSGIAFLPGGAQRFPLGSRVTIYEGVKLIASGEIKQFSKSQLNRRIWL